MAKDITNLTDLVEKLRELNPPATIVIDHDSYNYILCDIPANELRLPSPFYYNDKNGITNKHKTRNGAYLAVSVDSL